MRRPRSFIFGAMAMAIAGTGSVAGLAVGSTPPVVVPQQTIQASDGATSDIFGTAVAMTDATPQYMMKQSYDDVR